MTNPYIAEYDALVVEYTEAPSYADLSRFVMESLDEDGDGKQALLAFDGFQAFYEHLDTLTHFDQQDCETPLIAHEQLLELVYLSLLAETLADIDPVFTNCEAVYTTHGLEMNSDDFDALNAEENAKVLGYLIEQMGKDFWRPACEMAGTTFYYTLAAREDNPMSHWKVLNLVRAQVLKARANLGSAGTL